jgi:hypothetical protein
VRTYLLPKSCWIFQTLHRLKESTTMEGAHTEHNGIVPLQKRHVTHGEAKSQQPMSSIKGCEGTARATDQNLSRMNGADTTSTPTPADMLEWQRDRVA